MNAAVGGATIAYRVDGPAHAPAILLLNSLGADVSMWDEPASRLAMRYRVVRHDARGHGASTAVPGPYTIENLARDALAVLDDIGIDRAHLVGISLGGMVAIWIAAHEPQRVRRVVLANTASRIGTPETWTDRADAVRRGGTAAVAPAVMERFFSERFRRDRPDVVARFETALRGFSADGYAGACVALRDADLASEVRSIVAPTLIVGGTEDVSTPVSDVERLHEQIDGSRLVLLRGAGHLSSVEEPEAFAAAVERFLMGGEVGTA